MTDCFGDARAMADGVRAGVVSAIELCRDALERADRAPGIVWEVDADRALADARAVDRSNAAGSDLPLLAGVPVLVKDNFQVAGVPMSLGVEGRTRVPEVDAFVVGRLRRAGAVVIGKAAMDTLAWSMTGQAQGFPPCPNPAAPGRLPGGSSGGSAAAVAAGIVPFALGSDTAGSTRLPAAWCGVVGLKPSRGLVPLTGSAPLAPSLDCVGILARTVADCLLALDVLTGGLEPAPRPGLLRIGVAPGRTDLRAQLLAAGHAVVEVAETWRAPGIGTVIAAEFAAAWREELELDALDDSIRAGIETGSAVPPGELARARKAIAAEERRSRAVFDDVDLLALPTCDVQAPPVSEAVPVAEASRNTRAFNAYGWPAISIPWDDVDGLQLVAAPGRDAWLLACAHTFRDQKSTVG